MNAKKLGAVLLAGCLVCVGMQVFPEQSNSIVASADQIETDEKTGLQYKIYDDHAVVYGMSEAKTKVTIPPTITTSAEVELPVTEIGVEAFFKQETLEEVNIGENVKIIGNNAFNDCTALKTVNFPDGLEVIDHHAFSSCTSLEEITLPSSLKTLGGSAFSGDTSLKTVNLLGGQDLIIGAYCFNGCTAIETVTMGAGIIEIKTNNEDSTFSGLENLTNIQLSPTLQALPYNAFYGCKSLKTIEFPDGLETIDHHAFSDCTALEEITLPPNLKTLGSNIFSGATNLKTVHLLGGQNLTVGKSCFVGASALETVTMGEGIVGIGEYAFEKLENLTNVQLSPTLQTIESYAFQNSGLAEIDIPESVQTIEGDVFTRCENLKSVKLHDGLKKMGRYVFRESNLEEIVIPATVETFVNNQTFLSSNLKAITFLGKDVIIESGISKDIVIHGYENSTAQAYAEKHGNEFVALDDVSPEPIEPNITLGDVDGTGNIDILDVILLNRYVLGKSTLSENQQKAADVDKNGKPEPADGLMIMKKIVGIITEF